MGSFAKKQRYERLNKRYTEKYNVPGNVVGLIRSMFLTGKKTRQEILEYMQKSYSTRDAEMHRMEETNRSLGLGIDFLNKATEEQFKDLTERDPQTAKEPKIDGENK